MREVEGGNARWFMRILRHEAGHAVDNAYRLRRRKRWREVFGPASLQYPGPLQSAFPVAADTSIIWANGMRRPIPLRISPKPSPSG